MNYKVGDKIICKKDYIPAPNSYGFRKGDICTITKYNQITDGINYFTIISYRTKSSTLYEHKYYDNFNIIDYFYSKNEIRKLKLLTI